MNIVFRIDNRLVTKKEYERFKRLEKYAKPKKAKKTKPRRQPKKLKLPKPIKKYSSYKEYLKSPEWRKIRKRILKRANYKCEICKVAKAYQVHHKHYKNIFKEKDKDLLAVCGVCHQDKHKILTDEYVEKRVNELIKQEGYH